ncbi:uncharacterized protein METZ01_LOCUS149480, partial [marine metagenome]
ITGIYYINGAAVVTRSGNYVTVRREDGGVGIYFGGDGDAANYYDNDNHWFRTHASAQFAKLTTNGLYLSDIDASNSAPVRILSSQGDYNHVRRQDEDVGIYLGGDVDPGTYYDNDTHHFRAVNTATYFARINSSGINAMVGGFLVNGTEAISSTRALSVTSVSASSSITGDGVHSTNTSVGFSSTGLGSDTWAFYGLTSGQSNHSGIWFSANDAELLLRGAGSSAIHTRIGKTVTPYINNKNIHLAGDPIDTGNIAADGTITSTGSITSSAMTNTLGSAVASTNLQTILNGVASKANRIHFRESGTERWLLGQGAASETSAFELYNSIGVIVLSVNRTTSLTTLAAGLAVTGAVTISTNLTLNGELYGNASQNQFVGINDSSPYDSAWGTASRGLAIASTSYSVIHLKTTGAGAARFSSGVGDGRYWMAYDDISGRHNIVVGDDGNTNIRQNAISWQQGDFTPLVGSKTDDVLHVNGGIQLTGNDDAIVFGRGTSSFFKDEEIGFGWGGGWYQTEGTWLRVRNAKNIYNAATTNPWESYYQYNTSGNSSGVRINNMCVGGIAQYGDADLCSNIYWNGSAWAKFDTGVKGSLLRLTAGYALIYCDTGTASTASLAERFRVANDGALYQSGSEFLDASRALNVAGGTFSASVNIIGGGTYVGNWGYSTLVLEDTAGYPGINYRNGNKNWLVRMSGVSAHEIQWAYSSDASSAGVGTYTHHMSLHTNGTLEVGGQVQAHSVESSGNVTAYSDRRHKTDLKRIENALFKVKSLTGYTYERTDIDTARQTGLIAQDVREVLPEAVSENTA